MKKSVYLTTSIPYVNGRPHLGHALELVQADALARYRRLRGEDVRFQTGTDDNALKNVQAAEAEGMPTQALVDRNAAAFAALRGPLNLSFDDFIRTSGNPQHAAGAAKLWRLCEAAGDIYRRAYRGLYCVGCEQFYAEDELVDGLCPEHLRPLEWVEEENYFFRLSRHADALRALIGAGELRVVPESRWNEVLRFIDRGLHDFSISRSRARARGWGIPVPGDPGQVMYVWWDALINYITALDLAGDGEEYARFWRESAERVHLIGKGILRFHAVYWPAMLLSAGLPLPTTIFVHEYLTVGGRKIGKSLGNAVDPDALVSGYGTDVLRHWLLREVPRGEDADFTVERLVGRANADLANGLGNLLNRTVSMIRRWRAGVIPSPGEEGATEAALRALAERVPVRIDAALREFDFRAAVGATWELVAAANRYVDETEPWALAKVAGAGDEGTARRLDTVLWTLAECLRLLATLLAPFLPGTSGRVRGQLGLAGDVASWVEETHWGLLVAGGEVGEAVPIFPRMEVSGL